MKLNLILIISLITTIFYCTIINKELATAKLQLKTHRQNTDILLTNLKRIYNEKEILTIKNTELNKAAEKDPHFDWYADISRTAVIKRLQAN